MAARKKKGLGGPAVTKEGQFTVVLEDLRSQFKVFGEALQGLNEKVDSGFERVDRRFEQVDQRFDAIDRRFEQVDQRFDGIDRRLDGIDRRLDGIDQRLDRSDQRFDGIDRRFDGIDRRFDQVDREIGLVKTAVIENSREIKDVRATVTRIEVALVTKVDRDEVESLVAHAVAHR